MKIAPLLLILRYYADIEETSNKLFRINTYLRNFTVYCVAILIFKRLGTCIPYHFFMHCCDVVKTVLLMLCFVKNDEVKL